MNYSRLFITTSAVLGIGIGGFAVASASTDGDQSGASAVDADVRLSDDTTTSPDIVFASSTGDEPRIFDYVVSDVAGDDVVSGLSVEPSGVCVKVMLDGEGWADICADAETIATGLAYGLFGNPDGSFIAVGIVPDSVDSVEIGGEPVDLNGNLWSAHLATDTPRNLSVGDKAAGLWAELPAAAG